MIVREFNENVKVYMAGHAIKIESHLRDYMPVLQLPNLDITNRKLTCLTFKN